jgi:hypothetical protein
MASKRKHDNSDDKPSSKKQYLQKFRFLKTNMAIFWQICERRKLCTLFSVWYGLHMCSWGKRHVESKSHQENQNLKSTNRTLQSLKQLHVSNIAEDKSLSYGQGVQNTYNLPLFYGHQSEGINRSGICLNVQYNSTTHDRGHLLLRMYQHTNFDVWPIM